MKVLIGHVGRLPNIKGTAGKWRNRTLTTVEGTGSLTFTSTTSTTANWEGTQASQNVFTLSLNAYNSSNVYQDGALPESKSLSIKYYKRIC